MRIHSDLVVAEQTLALSGTVTGILNMENSGGRLSVILESSAGNCTVTYELGYHDPSLPHIKQNDATDLTFITPADGGAITGLSGVTADAHGTVSVDPCPAIRFTITENGTAQSTVKLIAMADRSI